MMFRFKGALYLTLLVGIFLSKVQGQTFTNLKEFDGHGYYPLAGLVSSNHTLYGTTYAGGVNGGGTVFKLDADGNNYSVIKEFLRISGTYSDGANPHAALLLNDGHLYGTTYYGGASGNGTVFEMDTNGNSFTNLHSFGNGEGNAPSGEMVLVGDTLFGTTSGAGSSASGTLFSIKTDGSSFTNLHAFVNYSLGSEPGGGLVVIGNTLYGTTHFGGAYGEGTVYKVNTDGSSFSVLKSFPQIDWMSGLNTNDDGAEPLAGLILVGQNLFGTTWLGGNSGVGTLFRIDTNGSNFGVVHAFSAGTSDLSTGVHTNSDGAYPTRLIVCGQTLFCITEGGGASGGGTIFKVKTNGSSFVMLKNLALYDGTVSTNTDAGPPEGLVLIDNKLFGTTEYGGGFSYGAVFSLDLAIPLNMTMSGNGAVLSWSDATFRLQAATSLQDVFTNVAGANNPYTNEVIGPQRFFRLAFDY